MHKTSYVLAKRFSQDPLETYTWKQHSPGAWIDKLPLYDFDYANTFRNQKVFKSIAIAKASDGNLESNRTRLMSEKKYKRNSPLLSSKFSSNYQIGT